MYNHVDAKQQSEEMANIRGYVRTLREKVGYGDL
jgi:hypothetical protein